MRVVLSVEPGAIDPVTNAERTMVRVVRSPFVVDKANRALEIDLNADALPGWEQPEAVKARGRQVRDSLCGHPGVAEVLSHLSKTQKEQTQPIFVMLSESDAELINWETLCDAKDAFIALDRRWPIGRITDPMSGSARPPAELQLPVRVMAVISAFGINGQSKEWDMLRNALAAARAAGLPVQMKLLVGEPALRTLIDQAIAAGAAPDVEVAPIEKTASRVLQEVAAWSPHILHFFCHGHADLTDQSLELATAGDHADPQATEGSVKIRADQLVDLSTQLANPWLLVLNCCSSGQAARNLQSMAHQVVSAGFPAAVAMSEPVDADDAFEFTRAFYRSLLRSLTAAAKKLKTDKRVPFEWTEAMFDARTALCDLHNGDAPNAREWALPVLYVRGVDPFHFERPHAEPEDDANVFKVRARIVAEWLRDAARDLNEAQRLAAMKHALAGVPPHYWPAPDGTFPGGNAEG
jgi:hypothetical protein